MPELDPREIVLGLLHRLRVLAPVGLLLWLLGVEISVGVRLLLVPAVLLVLVLDTVAGTTATGGPVFRVRPGGAR